MLIVDEMVSFGRVPGGSGIAWLGIEPDLWVGGKCLANGLPLTAIVGPEKYMRRFSIDTFHSMTHAGEALSLAAALGTLDVLDGSPDVISEIELLGTDIIELFYSNNAENRLRYAYPTRLLFDFSKAELGVMLANGVLCQPFANLTRAHAMDPVARKTILDAFRAVLGA